MGLTIRVFLLLTVLGISGYAVQANKLCDWGRGTCTYYRDPCPPNWERCPQYDSDCPVATNHCCCRKKSVPPPSAGKCDWGRGTCTYVNDPCPPNWERCPDFDKDCPLKTNHCCCRKQLKSVPLLPLLRPVKKDGMSPKGGGRGLGGCGSNTDKIDGADRYRRCDYPKGVCTYINDNCPPGMNPCGNYYCPLPTNRCCCR